MCLGGSFPIIVYMGGMRPVFFSERTDESLERLILLETNVEQEAGAPKADVSSSRSVSDVMLDSGGVCAKTFC